MLKLVCIDNKIFSVRQTPAIISFKTSRKTCKLFIFKMINGGAMTNIDETEIVAETVEESFSDLFELL